MVLVTNDEETRTRTARLTKQKDDEDGITINFKLGRVVVGINPKTEREITSCVVLSVTEAERLKREQQRLGYSPSPTERRIMMNLFKAIDRHGRLITHNEEPRAGVGKVVVDWRTYRDVALETIPELENKTKAADQIRKEFARAKDGLLKAGVLGVVTPHMWWEGKPVRGFGRTFPRGQDSDESWTGAGREQDNAISPGMQEVFDLDPEDGEISL